VVKAVFGVTRRWGAAQKLRKAGIGGEFPQGCRRVHEKMARHFEAIPIAFEKTRFPAFDVRDGDIVNAARLQPRIDVADDSFGVIEVFEDVEGGDDIEGGRSKGRIEDVTNKDIGASAFSGMLCLLRRDLDAGQSPGVTFHGAEERSSTTPEVEEPSAHLVTNDGVVLKRPAELRGISRGCNGAVVIRAVVLANLGAGGRIFLPDKRARLAAKKVVGHSAKVEAIGSTEKKDNV